MKFIILGSGGAIRIPKACCSCSVCTEARLKGFPYKRLGASLYMYESNILFDTPEDINEELNYHNIMSIDSIFYSHWHPDHTLGCRIIETIMSDMQYKKTINVYMPENNINIEINSNSLFNYYHSEGYCNVIKSNEPVSINSITIKKIKLLNNFVEAFLIVEGNKKVLYCPCHTMHLPYLEELHNLDLMILGKGYSSVLNQEWTNFQRDTLRIIDEFKPKRVILTHIEEIDGIGYDEYKKLERSFINLEFGYDGQIIKI